MHAQTNTGQYPPSIYGTLSRMTRPTARVLALLEILQAGGTRTTADLAGRLDVDERTVRRYIDHLIDLDIPVRSVRGRYCGYRLAPGYKMPPLMFTDDEAVAVMLGLVAGLRAGLITASAIAMESAAAKIRRVLPEALGRRLDALLATADFTTAARPAATRETGVLLLLAEAARHRRPAARVLSGLAEVPYRHEVSLRVLGPAEQVRARLPAGIATVAEIPADPAV